MERKIHAKQAQNYVALGSVIQHEWLICKLNTLVNINVHLATTVYHFYPPQSKLF